MSIQELLTYTMPSKAERANRHEKCLHEIQNTMNNIRSEIECMLMDLSTPIPKLLVDSLGYEESDDDIEVTLDQEHDSCNHTIAQEVDEFITSSIDDLVPIPRDSEVTLVREYVVNFFIENKDIDLPRHMVKKLFNHLVNNPNFTKRMFDGPLGNDNSKPRSYDVTFSNPLFDFNDDYTLSIDNQTFDEEFEDINILDPLESTLVIDECTLVVTSPLDFKQISLREVERFDSFFSLTRSGEIMKVMETSSLGFHHMSSSRPTAYSLKVVLYRFYLPNLTLGDRYAFEPRRKIPLDREDSRARGVAFHHHSLGLLSF
ncbi:hypothetical protein Tco_1111636 [Tanacetum coccineum]|uniref:Reverse transcriptase domain-containing protein n=1 Tax=Tanacetum coccineum TaxID=301880 RepID=A0ABQ5IMA1_9ASTR